MSSKPAATTESLLDGETGCTFSSVAGSISTCAGT